MERTGRLCQRSVSAILLLGFTAVADADTLCVAPSGTGGCFANITDAVAAAATLDKITVAPGTYKESGITITGLDGVFSIHSTVDEALAALQA